MHHHRVHSDQFEQHNVFSKISLQRGVGHGVTAIFDDQRFAVKLANVRQCLGKNFSFVTRRYVGKVWVSHGI